MISRKKNTHTLSFSRLDVGGDVPISIDASGVITTQDTEGDAFVLVKDVYSGQSAVVKVIVKKVHTIQLLPSISDGFNVIPVGGTQEYQILLSDDSGLIFESYHGVNVKFDMNTDQIISIDSLQPEKVVFRAIKDGSVVVRAYISDQNQFPEHFLLLVTGNAV